MKDLRPKGSISATLFVGGGKTFDPALFSHVAHCEPTEIWRRENLRVVVEHPDVPHIVWRFHVSERPQWSIDDAVREILTPFKEHQAEIVAFVRESQSSVHISLRLHGDETQIVYQLEAPTIALLAAFEASFAFSVDLPPL